MVFIKFMIMMNYLFFLKKLKDVKLRKDIKRRFMKNERSKLGDGLRYDIFKRDKFRCKVCGFSVNDEVKLHVDHIIPCITWWKNIN